MKKEELREIYFDLYDQLDEPYRSQAKNNFTEDGSIGCVDNIQDALTYGFAWSETSEGVEYWNDLYRNILIDQEPEIKPWKPKQGDMVEVSDDGKLWFIEEFVAEIDYPRYKYVTVPIDCSIPRVYRRMRQTQSKITVTKEEIADWKGVRVEYLEILDKRHEK